MVLDLTDRTDTDIHSTASFPGQPGQAGTRMVKPVWILMKQEIMWWQWHELDHTQIFAPHFRQITISIPHDTILLQVGCSSCCPTDSVKSAEGISDGTWTYQNYVKIPFLVFFSCFVVGGGFIMVVLWNRTDHYIFILSFLLSFFPRLISAVADWMSAILPHMVWP